MNARVSFASLCVFGVVVLGVLVGCASARAPSVVRCNHDEKQAEANRLSKRDMTTQPQVYIDETTGNLSLGPLRIYRREVDPGSDTLLSNPMACTKFGDSVLANGKWYTCNSDDVADSKKISFVRTLLREKVFPDAAKILSLNRIQGSLNISQSVYGGVLETQSYRLTDADILVYVTFRPDSWDVVATGTSLSYDQNGRPILGLLNWNPRNIDTSSSDLMYKVALHELFHVLGFSQGRMLNFRNISTLNETTGDIDVYDQLQLDGVEMDNREITFLMSPAVKEAFREHFDCDSLEGGVLEDQGGSNIAGSHWEMTSTMDELMTATVSTQSVLTNLTLALFEDSGWYQVNRSFSNRLLWGYKMGCEFVRNRCNSSWPVGQGYFCPGDKKGVEGCTYDRMAIGSCDFRYWVSIPEKYRYFGDEHLGGPVEYADYCPFTYGTYYCEEASSKETSSYGDLGGAGSRCFVSSLSDSPDTTTKQLEAPKCYPHHCITNESFAVKIGSYWYPCPNGESVSEVIGFTGSLLCPNASLLCYSKVTPDRRFPIFVSIEPTSAKPGTEIRITGKNFGSLTNVTVGVPCNDVKYDSATGSITCVISEDSAASATAGLKNLVIKQNGFMLAVPNAFTLELGIQNWILQNWYLSACVAIAAVVILLTVIILICKCCTTSRKWKKYQECKAASGQKPQQKPQEFGSDVEFDSMA